MKDADARALLRALFDAALAVARPATCLAPYIDALKPPKGRTVVVGAGKASAAMAKALEDRWPHPLEGLIVTRYGYSEPCKRIEIVEAAHPVPDAKGSAAAGRLLAKVKGLSPDDLDETRFSAFLSTAGMPDPDLIIRTSGEQRLSNFLLWQCAYSELVFVPIYWPDFDRQALDEAVAIYRQRERRFGGLAAKARS